MYTVLTQTCRNLTTHAVNLVHVDVHTFNSGLQVCKKYMNHFANLTRVDVHSVLQAHLADSHVHSSRQVYDSSLRIARIGPSVAQWARG